MASIKRTKTLHKMERTEFQMITLTIVNYTRKALSKPWSKYCAEYFHISIFVFSSKFSFWLNWFPALVMKSFTASKMLCNHSLGQQQVKPGHLPCRWHQSSNLIHFSVAYTIWRLAPLLQYSFHPWNGSN